MGNGSSSPTKGKTPLPTTQNPAVKSPVSLVNKSDAKSSFNLKAANCCNKALGGHKHSVEFFIVFLIVLLFILGLIFATPVEEYDLAGLPPPPIWSRGIARPAKILNTTVTDSFAFLKTAGFTPSSILDVGAFSGDWSRAAEKMFPEAEIFLIEASEDRRDDLMKTGLSYMIATAGAKPETIEFYDIPGKKANSRFKELSEDYVSDSPVKKVTYPVDMLMEGLPAVSMMKIDTQGSELKVIEGAGNVLKDVEVLYITVPLMRIHKGAPLALEILSVCKELGFELINYVDGDARGVMDALVHVDLTLAKKHSPIFSKISEGIILHDEILKLTHSKAAIEAVEEDRSD